jgi:arylsulfatase A-like enzyme
MLEELKKLGLDENTIVVFSSDNGPVLDDGYDDASVEKCGTHKPAGPLRGGKYSLFDGGARVPMIVRAPGRIAPGTESPALFSHADFLASFASLAGNTLAPEATADSEERSAVLLGKDLIGRDNLVTEGFGAKTVVRQDNWVFIPPYKGPPLFGDKGIETGNSKEPQLYDLYADIGQRDNLASEMPDKIEALHRLLKSIHGKKPPMDSNPETVASV